MLINNVEVTHEGFVPFSGELARYVQFVKERVPNVTKINCRLADDGGIDLHWAVQGQPFERIRRITGYLTGDLNTWNNAKRAEEHDRVKHDPKL